MQMSSLRDIHQQKYDHLKKEICYCCNLILENTFKKKVKAEVNRVIKNFVARKILLNKNDWFTLGIIT